MAVNVAVSVLLAATLVLTHRDPAEYNILSCTRRDAKVCLYRTAVTNGVMFRQYTNATDFMVVNVRFGDGRGHRFSIVSRKWVLDHSLYSWSRTNYEACWDFCCVEPN